MNKIKYAVFLLLGSIIGCQKADLSAINNLRNNEIAILGHGGFGFNSPEVNIPTNSFEGITKAVEGYQTDGVEVDVQISNDGVLFLYHDLRLQTLTDCLGCLYQYDAETLDECRYVRGFNTQNFKDQKLVRLETILARFDERAPKPYIFLDLKTSLDCPQTFDNNSFENTFVQSLIDLFEKYNCQDWVYIESGSLSFLQRLKAGIPDIRLFYFNNIEEASIQIAIDNEFSGISSNFKNTTRALISAAHDEGLFVVLGIQKIRRDAIEMIEMSPDFIYTDNISLMQSILN